MNPFIEKCSQVKLALPGEYQDAVNVLRQFAKALEDEVFTETETIVSVKVSEAGTGNLECKISVPTADKGENVLLVDAYINGNKETGGFNSKKFPFHIDLLCLPAGFFSTAKNANELQGCLLNWLDASEFQHFLAVVHEGVKGSRI